MAELSRRTFFKGLAVTGALIATGAEGTAAAADKVTVVVSGNALAALVREVGGDHVTIATGGDGLSVEIGGKTHAMLDPGKLKGKGEARARFLDDPRFAPGIGAKLRDLLSAADPAHAADFAANHKAWSRKFGLEVVKWTKQLRASKVAGRTVSDPHGRAYLLAWAGAQIDASAKAPPAALADVPGGPAAPTLAAYQAYIGKLVAAVM